MSRNREDKDLEQARHRLAESNARLERELSELRDLKARERALEEEVAALERDIAARERDTAERERDTAERERDTAILERDTMGLRRDAMALQRNTAALEARKAAGEARVAALEQEFAAQQLELAESREILAARKAELAARIAQNAELDSKIAASTAALQQEQAALARERVRAKAVDEEHARVKRERARETGVLAQVLAQKLLDGATLVSINAQLSAIPNGAKILEIASGDTELIALILLIEAIKLGNIQAQQILDTRFEGVDVNDLSIPDANGDIDEAKTAQINAIIAEFVAELMPQPGAGGAAQYGPAVVQPAAHAAGASGTDIGQRRPFVGMCLIEIVPLNIDYLSRSEKTKSHSKSIQQESKATITHGNGDVDTTTSKWDVWFTASMQTTLDSYYTGVAQTLTSAIYNYVESSLQTLWALFDFKHQAQQINKEIDSTQDRAAALVLLHNDLMSSAPLAAFMLPHIDFSPPNSYPNPDPNHNSPGNNNDAAMNDSGLAYNITGATNCTDSNII